jgi:hypothetical protein
MLSHHPTVHAPGPRLIPKVLPPVPFRAQFQSVRPPTILKGHGCSRAVTAASQLAKKKNRSHGIAEKPKPTA